MTTWIYTDVRHQGSNGVLYRIQTRHTARTIQCCSTQPPIRMGVDGPPWYFDRSSNEIRNWIYQCSGCGSLYSHRWQERTGPRGGWRWAA